MMFEAYVREKEAEAALKSPALARRAQQLAELAARGRLAQTPLAVQAAHRRGFGGVVRALIAG
jgi:hypothetical protein